jgi:alanyl-tRNA synthetase
MEVVYVNAGSIIQQYKEFCNMYNITISIHNNVKSYDNTTLFCSAGMQQFKSLYRDPTYRNTIANIQKCFRLNDIDCIDDGFHSLAFDMIGLFSFHEYTVEWAIDFWFVYLQRINILPTHVTIHPFCLDEWLHYYKKYNVKIQPDSGCIWSDGEQGGYCTEFYVNDLEIGNIVNTGGDSIDAGFGLDRLMLCMGSKPLTEQETLIQGIETLINSGFSPGNRQQGYILRRLLRILYKKGWSYDHPFFIQEVSRQKKLRENYNRLLPKNLNKTREWWKATHGIDPLEL